MYLFQTRSTKIIKTKNSSLSLFCVQFTAVNILYFKINRVTLYAYVFMLLLKKKNEYGHLEAIFFFISVLMICLVLICVIFLFSLFVYSCKLFIH